jgi:hypothetical protein
MRYTATQARRPDRSGARIRTHISAAPNTFVIRVRAKRGVDPIRALRGMLKVLGRRFGLRAVTVEVETGPTNSSNTAAGDNDVHA